MRTKGLVLGLRGSVGKGSRYLNWLLIPIAVVYLLAGFFYFGVELLGIGSASAGAQPNTSADIQLYIGAWLAYIFPLFTFPVVFLLMQQRIALDGRGIHYRSRLPGMLKALYPSWSVSWQELTGVSWAIPKKRELLSRLTLHTKRGDRTVTPGYWAVVDDTDDGWPKMALGISRDEALSLVNDTAIVRVLAGVRADLHPEAPIEETGRQQFSSAQIADMTPATMAVAFSFFALVLYFITDNYFGASEYYVGGAPMAALFGAGALGAILAYLFVNRLEPERRDTAKYALLFGFGVGLACHPFLARVNAWTDEDGLQTYDYRLGDDYVWRAELKTSPDLELYLSSSKWWQQFKPGDAYAFNLRKGGLGLWQVDMTPIYNAQKKFYEKHRR